jgi:hypothetical protein
MLRQNDRIGYNYNRFTLLTGICDSIAYHQKVKKTNQKSILLAGRIVFATRSRHFTPFPKTCITSQSNSLEVVTPKIYRFEPKSARPLEFSLSPSMCSQITTFGGRQLNISPLKCSRDDDSTSRNTVCDGTRPRGQERAGVAILCNLIVSSATVEWTKEFSGYPANQSIKVVVLHGASLLYGTGPSAATRKNSLGSVLLRYEPQSALCPEIVPECPVRSAVRCSGGHIERQRPRCHAEGATI